MSVWVAQGLAVGVLARATWTDLRSQTISNYLNLAALTIGLGLAVWGGRVEGALAGIGVAGVVHLPLWILAVERGGDVKLFLALGALLGPEVVLRASLAAFALFLPVGLVGLSRARPTPGAGLDPSRSRSGSEGRAWVPFSPLITAGTLLAMTPPWTLS